MTLGVGGGIIKEIMRPRRIRPLAEKLKIKNMFEEIKPNTPTKRESCADGGLTNDLEEKNLKATEFEMIPPLGECMIMNQNVVINGKSTGIYIRKRVSPDGKILEGEIGCSVEQITEGYGVKLYPSNFDDKGNVDVSNFSELLNAKKRFDKRNSMLRKAKSKLGL